jgi:hypothetical protein
MGTGQNEWFTPADYVELARRNRFLIRANLQKFFWGGVGVGDRARRQTNACFNVSGALSGIGSRSAPSNSSKSKACRITSVALCRRWGLCRLRLMDRPVPDDITVYLVVNDFGKFGKAYVETDITEADREAIIRSFISGQYSNALRVVAFNTAEGWSRDVSEDIANEVLERVFDADDNLSEDTKRFIDRHVNPGEKRPPAPSVRRVDSAQKKRA